MSASPPPHTISTAREADLADLLVLMRAYCDFYDASPSDAALLELSRTLLADPQREGFQLIARDAGAMAVGFTTVFWSWDTTEAGRIGIMNDLYVDPAARGTGLADRLIAESLARSAARGACRLEWQTEDDNTRAQAVYDRVGGVREPFMIFTKRAPSA